MARQPIELREEAHDEKLKLKTWLVVFRGPSAEILGHRAHAKKTWGDVQLCRKLCHKLCRTLSGFCGVLKPLTPLRDLVARRSQS